MRAHGGRVQRDGDRPHHLGPLAQCPAEAGALIASLPTLLVYIILGRWFVGGLMAGSVKGWWTH